MYVPRWFLGAMLCATFMAPTILYAQDITSGPIVNSLQNDPTTGTLLNRLAKITPQGTLVLPAVTDTAIDLYVVIAGAGTTGTAFYVEVGRTGCEFDNATTNKAGTYVVNSPTTVGRCHQQDAPPANGMVIGKLKATTTVVGGVAEISAKNTPYIPGSGAVSTSVGLTMPAEFPVANSPVVNSGTLIVTEANQAANTAYMGPASGAAAAPGYRALVLADLPAGVAAGTCTGDLAGTFPACTVLQASLAFAFTGELRPSALGGDVNDYNPAGLATATGLFVDSGGVDRNWTGLAGGTDGRQMPVCNRGTTGDLVLKDESASSSAGSRFAFGADVRLRPKACFWLEYDATLLRWRPATSALLDHFIKRPCQWLTGDPSPSLSAPLAVDQDTPDACANDTGADWVIESFACKTDAGTVSVQPTLTGGTATSILTAAVTCGTSWTAGTINGTPTVHSFSSNGATCAVTPCSVFGDLTTVDGTARSVWYKFNGRLQK